MAESIQYTRRMNTLRLFHRSIAISLFFLLTVQLPAVVTGGEYRVHQDEEGVYLETDQHGGWYVAPEDQSDFKVGQSGSYQLWEDAGGAYIEIDKQHRYYLAEGIDELIENENEPLDQAKKPPTEKPKTTAVVIYGNQVLVPVTIGYKKREIEVLLLLDTGASVITLHKNVADRLALPSGYRSRLMAAGGRKIDAGLVKLGSVKFGPYHRSNLVAAVIKNHGTSVDYHGLLGMNALRGVDFRIDHAHQVIRWGF